MTWPQKLIWMTKTKTFSGIHLCESYVYGELIEFYVYTYIHHLYTNWIEANWRNSISYILKPNFRCEMSRIPPRCFQDLWSPLGSHIAHGCWLPSRELTSPSLKGTFEDDVPLVGYLENPLRVWLVRVSNGQVQSFQHNLDAKKLLHYRHPMCLMAASPATPSLAAPAPMRLGLHRNAD